MLFWGNAHGYLGKMAYGNKLLWLNIKSKAMDVNFPIQTLLLNQYWERSPLKQGSFFRFYNGQWWIYNLLDFGSTLGPVSPSLSLCLGTTLFAIFLMETLVGTVVWDPSFRQNLTEEEESWPISLLCVVARVYVPSNGRDCRVRAALIDVDFLSPISTGLYWCSLHPVLWQATFCI